MKTISAEEFDRRFDAGEDMMEYVDLSTARRPGLEPQQVTVTLPQWLLTTIELEARRSGRTCNEVLVAWLLEHTERSAGH